MTKPTAVRQPDDDWPRFPYAPWAEYIANDMHRIGEVWERRDSFMDWRNPRRAAEYRRKLKELTQ